MKNSFGLLVLFQLFLVSQSTFAQLSIKVPLTVRDIVGHRHSITFGVDARATYGFDVDLGEMPIPPVPGVPAFDVRFLDPEGRKQYPYEGAYIDLRPYFSPAQSDTFHVHFQPSANKYPVYVKWPMDALRNFGKAFLILVERGEERHVNMKEVGMVEILSGNSLVIVTKGVTATE